MTTPNKQVLLASRPQGRVTEDNFRIVEASIGRPAAGEVLVRNEWLSLDPYMRGRMSEAKSYVPPVEIGAVMTGQTVGEVVESRHPGFRPGDRVLTSLGWQQYGVAKGKELRLVDVSRVPASYYLGILGMPGMTAWFGLFEIGKPQPGETLVVSAASGAVGSVVGQLAKNEGLRVVGIAGGREKCDYVVRELGFDACVDYRAGRAPGRREAALQGIGGRGAGQRAAGPDRAPRRPQFRQAAGEALDPFSPGGRDECTVEETITTLVPARGGRSDRRRGVAARDVRRRSRPHRPHPAAHGTFRLDRAPDRGRRAPLHGPQRRHGGRPQARAAGEGRRRTRPRDHEAPRAGAHRARQGHAPRRFRPHAARVR